MNDETITCRLDILTRLIKWFVTSYKEEKNKEEYANKRIERWYGRGHHIHQVQWKLWQVWWVEREYQVDFKAQGNTKVLNK